MAEITEDQIVVVDFRSDTVTKPDAEMRQAMFEAEVGDDVFREDPTVNELEKRAAALFGKEAALFTPTGTMSNLIAVMCHCTGRGDEMLVGNKSHIFVYEQGGSSSLAGVHVKALTNQPDGTLNLQEIKENIRPDDYHFPATKLVCLENTHNGCGGRVIPLSFIKEVRRLADDHGIKVHIDGARIMNAAVASNQNVAEIVQYCDSVSTCLSKGLGAPVGSVLAGTEEFIRRARRCRKALGGGMRQAGVLAAAGLLALDSGVKRLHVDHENAKVLAQGIRDLKCPLVSTSVEDTDSNMVMLDLHGVSAVTLADMMGKVTEEEQLVLGRGLKVKMLASAGATRIRMVTHKHITSEHVRLTIKKFKLVFKHLEKLK
ncbi:L-allo-threonine aldolase-like [Ptychodera flava]|uniref:L-allo-threonine aldolase-like n=1 Tax=Ptychodera flava TaxID=63121 RepID=UPI00396A54C0